MEKLKMAHTKQVEEFSTDVQKVLDLNETQPRYYHQHTVENLDSYTTTTTTAITANTNTTANVATFNTTTANST